MISTIHPARWRRGAPDAMRDLDTLPQHDYTDLFTVPLSEAVDGDVQQWFQARLIDGASPRLRALLRFTYVTQKLLLGLRLLPSDTPGSFLGWRIAAHGPTWMRLETESRFITPHLVFRVEGGTASFSTFIQYRRRSSRLLWAMVRPLHRRVGLTILRWAA